MNGAHAQGGARNADSPQANRAAILDALAVMFDPVSVVELRAIHKHRKRTDSGYFDGEHREALADAALKLNTQGAAVYVTLSPINPQLLGRYCNRVQDFATDTTTDANVIRRRWLLIDFDPVRPKDTSATDEQVEAARACARACYSALRAAGWPEPLTAMSGNGFHLLYPVDLPNDSASCDLVKGALAGLAARFDTDAVKVDQTVFNAARIGKVYGTVANKGDNTPRTPWRRAELISKPERGAVATPEQLRALHPPRPETQAASKIAPGGREAFDLTAFLVRLAIDHDQDMHEGRDRYRLAHCPFNTEHGKGESAIFRSADGRLGFKCQHDSCANRTWQDVRALVDGPREQRTAKGGHRSVAQYESGIPPPEAEAETDDAPRLQLVDLTDLSAPTTVRYLIEPILPRAQVTLLGGHGGSGKSIVALTWCAHVACGRAWAGLPVIQGRALFASLEDDAGLVRWRLGRIVEACNLDPASVRAGLRIVDGADADSALAVELSEYGIRRLLPTPAMDELREHAKGCGLIVIDGASDGFDGDENSRRLVRSFLRLLAQMARAENAAVLILAHIDKSAARQGSAGNSYSGSTAWHNSVRSRVALVDVDDRIELRQEKLNLGRRHDPIALTWNPYGVLLPAGGIHPLAPNLDPEAESAVLAAIVAATARGVDVPTGRTGPSTTYLVLSTFAEIPKSLGKARFWWALDRLQQDGKIERETYINPYRHERERWIPRQLGARCNPPHTPPQLARAGGRANARVALVAESDATDATGAEDGDREVLDV